MLLLLSSALASSMLFAAVPTGLAPQAPGENQFPACYAGPNITVACQGETTTVTVDGTGSVDPDGDLLTFQWGACPGSYISDPTSPITEITFDTSETCSLTCGVRLLVVDPYGGYSACRLYVAVVPGNEGCSLGYWKNHLSQWDEAGLAWNDDFDTIFGFNAFTPNRTLLQALALGGGGKNKLARQGVAALLNAAHPDVEFPLSIGEVIDAVHNALVSGQYEPIASTLEQYDNLACPLGNGCPHHQGGGQHHCSHGGNHHGGCGFGGWGWAGSFWWHWNHH